MQKQVRKDGQTSEQQGGCVHWWVEMNIFHNQDARRKDALGIKIDITWI